MEKGALGMRMRFGRGLVLAGLALALTLGLFGVPTASAGAFLSPSNYMNAYVSLINSRNFPAAYAEWVNPPQTYESFVAGYADTQSVQGYFGGLQPGDVNNLVGGVPSVLYGYRTNGTVAAFSGCYFLLYTGGPGTGLDVWSIVDANLTPLNYIPTLEQADALIKSTRCYARTDGRGNYLSVQSMLGAYYDVINNRDYATAYGLWRNPPQTYYQFVAGFANTREVAMFYGNYQYSGVPGAYEAGRVPVMVMGFHNDGNVVAYRGCFRLNYDPWCVPNWAIIGANLTPVSTDFGAPDRQTVLSAMAASCY